MPVACPIEGSRARSHDHSRPGLRFSYVQPCSVRRGVQRPSKQSVEADAEPVAPRARVPLATFSVRVHTQGVARCRARTEDGTGPLCARKVKKEGLRCWQHRGLPTAPPRISQSPRSRTRSANKRTPMHEQRRQQREAIRAARIEDKQRERVRKAADYCNDILTDGWAEAVAERATDYVTDETWKRLLKSRSNQCRTLAQIAQRISAGKDKLHDWLGSFVSWILSLIGVGAAAREFAGELASNIPIPPIDAKIVAVARGIQVTGILLCVVRDENLTRCQCFIDLALVEAKTRVRKILVTAMGDWTRLAEFSLKENRQAMTG